MAEPRPGTPSGSIALAAAPSVWPSYLRTVAGAAGLARPKRPANGAAVLRRQGMRLTGVLPELAHVDRYRELVGTGSVERLPLLYPHLLGFGMQLSLMTQSGFPFPLLGLVHVRNEVLSTGPLPVGARLDVEVTVGPVRPHPRGRTVDLLTVVGRDGAPEWTETSTYLHRERTAEAGAHPADARPADAVVARATVGEPAAAGEPAMAGEPAADLHLSARWRLPGDLGRRYGALSGDRNPIHLHPLSAKAFGFPRAIAHGMWSAAAVAAALEHRLPAAVRFDVSFRRPVLLPGTVRLLTAVTADAVRAELRGREDKDTLHLDATATPYSRP
jgi:acyl dehydratase